MLNHRRIDLITGVLFTLLGIVLLVALIPYGVVEPAKVKFAALSPSYYPRLISYALIVLGLLILGFTLFRPKAQMKLEKSEALDAETTNQEKPFNILIAIAILALFYAFLNQLGFVLGSSITLALLLLLAKEKKPHVILLISLIVPLTLYFFFTKVANIPIPTGILETILVGG